MTEAQGVEIIAQLQGLNEMATAAWTYFLDPMRAVFIGSFIGLCLLCMLLSIKLFKEG